METTRTLHAAEHAICGLAIGMCLVASACASDHDCAVRACGSDGGADAPEVDAAIEVDAAAPSDPDAVTVILRIGPPWGTNAWDASSTIVVFHDANGVPIDVQHAEPPDGIVVSTRAGVAAVTVQPGVGATLLTLTDVAAGDTIRFEPSYIVRGFDVPAPPPGTTTFSLAAPCEYYGATASASPHDAACVGNGPSDVVFYADDGVHYYYTGLFDGPASDGATLPPWRDISDIETTGCVMQGAPAGATSTFVSAGIATSYGWPMYVGGCESGSLSLPHGIPANVHVLLDAITAFADHTQIDVITELSEDARAHGVVVDLSQPPWVTGATPDAHDPAHLSVAWTTSGTDSAAHLEVSVLDRYVWDVAAPGSVQRIELPTLPDELAFYRPALGATWSLTVERTAEAYATYVRNPLGPRDPRAWVGASTRVSGTF